MQNYFFCTLHSALTPLRGLFLLAARQSEQAPSALAPQRRFCILHSLYKILFACELGVSVRFDRSTPEIFTIPLFLPTSIVPKSSSMPRAFAPLSVAQVSISASGMLWNIFNSSTIESDLFDARESVPIHIFFAPARRSSTLWGFWRDMYSFERGHSTQ